MDFCDEGLGTTVEITKPCVDGYEVHNLISKDASLRRKGCLVERFIKVPVHVTFSFPCQLELRCVLIGPSVGSSKSTGLSLFSGTGSGSGSTEPEDVLIGKWTLQSEERICFVNKSFRARPPFSDSNFDERVGTSTDGVPQRAMKCQVMDAVRRSLKLRVHIWRTQGSSLVALGKVAVYAVPSRGVDVATVDRLFRQFLTPPSRVADRSCGPTPDQSRGPEPIQDRPEDDGERKDPPILDDFLDAITSSIMTFPIILPSGNVVDQSTLDKYNSEENSWGRQPNDPFTGLPLTREWRPIPNAALKSRIDQFLLRHDGLCLGRAVGSGRVARRNGIGWSPPIGIGPIATGEIGHPTGGGDVRSVDVGGADAGGKDVGGSSAPKATRVRPSGRKKRAPDEPWPSTSKRSREDRSSSGGIPGSGHTSRLDSSLDTALKTTLGSFDSLAASSSWPMPEEEAHCRICGKGFESVPLYSLPCSHVVCKGCFQIDAASERSDKQCPSCHKPYATSEVCRTHR